jgi:hypothetical protein
MRTFLKPHTDQQLENTTVARQKISAASAGDFFVVRFAWFVGVAT